MAMPDGAPLLFPLGLRLPALARRRGRRRRLGLRRRGFAEAHQRLARRGSVRQRHVTPRRVGGQRCTQGARAAGRSLIRFWRTCSSSSRADTALVGAAPPSLLGMSLPVELPAAARPLMPASTPPASPCKPADPFRCPRLAPTCAPPDSFPPLAGMSCRSVRT